MPKERDSKTERELALYVLEPVPGDSKDVLAHKRLLAPVYNGLFDVSANQRNHEEDCGKWRTMVLSRLDSIDMKLKADHERLTSLEDADEITGVQAIAELKEQLAEKNESARWWKRWALGIAASLLVAGLSAGAGYALKGAVSSAGAATR